MIKIKDISFSFASRTQSVFADISFNVLPHETVAILGPSGCGKSTLLRCIAGLLSIEKGEIRINDLSPDMARKEQKIGFVFQEPTLIPWLSVEDNIKIASEINLDRNKPIETNTTRVNELLKLVRLEGINQQYPSELSGGMAQRVSLARSLYKFPDILLLDEPFSAIDYLTKIKIIRDFQGIVHELNRPIILITHDIEEAVLLADRIVILAGIPTKIVKEIHIPEKRHYKGLPQIDENALKYRNEILQTFSLYE